jgi:hypothetical protein
LRDLTNRVTFIEGEMLDADTLHEAVAGADAVIGTLRQVADAPADLMTRTITNAASATRCQAVRRIVVLDNASIPAPGHAPTLGLGLMSALMGLTRGVHGASSSRRWAGDLQVLRPSRRVLLGQRAHQLPCLPVADIVRSTRTLPLAQRQAGWSRLPPAYLTISDGEWRTRAWRNRCGCTGAGWPGPALLRGTERQLADRGSLS